MDTHTHAYAPFSRCRSKTTRYILTAIMSSMLFCVSQNTFACTGADYERTMQVVNYSMQIGYEFGMTGNYSLFTQRLQEITQAINQLPPSCRALLQQMNSGFSSGGSGTTCMGGVCCDSTGCY